MYKSALCISMGGLAWFVACSDDTTNPAGSTTTGTSATTSTTSMNGAGGGTGGSAQGGQAPGGQAPGGQAPGGQGQGGNASCVSCSAYYASPASVSVTDVCGVQTYDPATWTFTCTAGSSCVALEALLQCACVTGCPDMDECGPDLCVGMAASNKCSQCLGQSCSNEEAACLADM